MTAALSMVAAAMLLANPASLQAETERWHQQRIARLKAEDGWLTLVALDWFDEGENPAGSAEHMKVPLPANAPAHLGTFTRHGKAVSFTPAEGVAVTLDGKPFPGGALKTDAHGEPDVLHVGTLQLLVIDRGERLGLRVRDSEAPLRKSFRDIERYPVDPTWRVEARFQPAGPNETMEVANVLGDVEKSPIAGTVTFEHGGHAYHLTALTEDGGLFFVFGDPTNRKETYGAGRFLTAEAPKDGKVVLDFNRAYNPPCAFSAFATCPVPPKENRLPIRVEAGEKRYEHP